MAPPFSNHRSLLQNAAQEPMSGMSSPEPDLAPVAKGSILFPWVVGELNSIAQLTRKITSNRG